MATDDLTWLGEALDVPWFVARPGQPLRVGGGMSEAVPETSPCALLAETTGASPSEVQVLLREAEEAGRAAATLGDFRVVIRSGPDGIAALCRPARTGTPDRAAADVSHELANALGSILGWTEIARGASESTETRRALDRIETSARTAEATARHYLESAHERGDADATLDVSALLFEIQDLAQPMSAQAGVRVAVHAEEPLLVHGGRPPAFTVFWNLIQNAIQATPSGGRVTLEGKRCDNGVAVTVTDTGPGIAAADRHRVFEPFFTTKRSGTGLGLALVLDGVKELAGTVEVMANPAGGARFRVVLPSASQSRMHRRSEVVARSALTGVRILVVDDDPAIRDLIATALGLAGAETTTADGSYQGMERAEPYDLALIDLQLGRRRRGDDLLNALRSSGLVTKAALVSGGAPPHDLRAEPDGWIRKPFELDELLGAVRALVADAGELVAKAM